MRSSKEYRALPSKLALAFYQMPPITYFKCVKTRCLLIKDSLKKSFWKRFLLLFKSLPANLSTTEVHVLVVFEKEKFFMPEK